MCVWLLFSFMVIVVVITIIISFTMLIVIIVSVIMLLLSLFWMLLLLFLLLTLFSLFSIIIKQLVAVNHPACKEANKRRGHCAQLLLTQSDSYLHDERESLAAPHSEADFAMRFWTSGVATATNGPERIHHHLMSAVRARTSKKTWCMHKNDGNLGPWEWHGSTTPPSRTSSVGLLGHVTM